jgi:hypothetical protein
VIVRGSCPGPTSISALQHNVLAFTGTAVAGLGLGAGSGTGTGTGSSAGGFASGSGSSAGASWDCTVTITGVNGGVPVLDFTAFFTTAAPGESVSLYDGQRLVGSYSGSQLMGQRVSAASGADLSVVDENEALVINTTNCDRELCGVTLK